MNYWRHEFRGGTTNVEDSPRSGIPPDFPTHLCVERALEASPNGSVRGIAELTGYEFSTVFDINIIIQVLHFKISILSMAGVILHLKSCSSRECKIAAGGIPPSEGTKQESLLDRGRILDSME